MSPRKPRMCASIAAVPQLSKTWEAPSCPSAGGRQWLRQAQTAESYSALKRNERASPQSQGGTFSAHRRVEASLTSLHALRDSNTVAFWKRPHCGDSHGQGPELQGGFVCGKFSELTADFIGKFYDLRFKHRFSLTAPARSGSKGLLMFSFRAVRSFHSPQSEGRGRFSQQTFFFK